MVVILFRSRLRPGNDEAFQALGAEMLARAEAMPGFLSYKVFSAADGERATVIEFATPEDLRAWREDPEHVAAMRRGREIFYSDYTLQVSDSVRESRFPPMPGAEGQST